MKLHRILTVSIVSLLLSANLFAVPDAQEVNKALENFALQLNKVVPNAATEQNVYSNAWIGKFIPSLPMHFALGIEGGVTKLDMSDLSKSAEAFHIASVPSTFVFPTLGFNGKIGGIFLPFDAGFSFFSVDTSKMGNLIRGLDINLFVIGGDFRYAILQGNGLCPIWSVGAGYYYSKGGIGTKSDESLIKLNYETHTLVAETQLSKKFIFITPFVGFRGVFVRSNAEYEWRSTTGLAGATLVYSGNGKVSTDFKDDIIPQLFGGLGLTLGLLQLDTNASYDFANNIWNGGISLRFQM